MHRHCVTALGSHTSWYCEDRRCGGQTPCNAPASQHARPIVSPFVERALAGQLPPKVLK